MRVMGLICAAILVTGCAKSETPPVADTTTPAAMETPVPAAPAPISAASMTGKWNVSVMGEQSDSVLTTYVLDATADSSKWTFAFPKGQPIPMKIVSLGGDSMVTLAGPFPSALRPGMKVTTQSVIRMQDGGMAGTIVAHYVTGKADSTANLRLKGTKAQ